MATVKSVRKAIEAAKAELIDLQANGVLGQQSIEHTVYTFSALDKAWLAICKAEWAKEIGQ